MALQEEFGRAGNWLFRRRSYLPLVLVALFLLSLPDYRYLGNSERIEHLWQVLCLAVGFAGLGIRAYTIGHTPGRTSGRNSRAQVAEQLNTTGIYSLLRHPLYVGNFFMFFGVILLPHSYWLALTFILLYMLYYERIMYAEEAFLRHKFGASYSEWAERTPAVLPRFSAFVPPKLDFSLRNVLRREYNGFFALIACMFVIETVQDYVVQQRLKLDLHWLIILGVSFLLWAVLRLLNKKTRLLKVEGR